jgi:hypothetical protein
VKEIFKPITYVIAVLATIMISSKLVKNRTYIDEYIGAESQIITIRNVSKGDHYFVEKLKSGSYSRFYYGTENSRLIREYADTPQCVELIKTHIKSTDGQEDYIKYYVSSFKKTSECNQ